jgi:hypothetical protein
MLGIAHLKMVAPQTAPNQCRSSVLAEINLIYMYDLLQLALDCDFYNNEIKAGLIPSRALFPDVRELAYLSEINQIIDNI